MVRLAAHGQGIGHSRLIAGFDIQGVSFTWSEPADFQKTTFSILHRSHPTAPFRRRFSFVQNDFNIVEHGAIKRLLKLEAKLAFSSPTDRRIYWIEPANADRYVGPLLDPGARLDNATTGFGKVKNCDVVRNTPAGPDLPGSREDFARFISPTDIGIFHGASFE